MCAQEIGIQEGTKDFCMSFKNRTSCRKVEAKETILELHTTRFNILIPLFISAFVFFVEIYSVYYVAGEKVNLLSILRLANTTFIPTHIATTTGFLYQHFSLVNNFSYGGKMRPIEEMEIKAKYDGFTLTSTIVLAVFYVVFSFGVNFTTQILLFVMQCIYMWILFKYSIRDKILIYEEQIRNVVSY